MVALTASAFTIPTDAPAGGRHARLVEHQHLAVAAATPNLRHLEWFHDHARVEAMLFDGAVDPTGGSAPVVADRPGNGLAFRDGAAAQWRVA